MSDFDLHALVVRELESSPTPDPYIVAKGVAAAIPAEEMRGVLDAVLPLYIRNVGNQWARNITRRDVGDTALDGACRKALAYITRKAIALSTEVPTYKALADCTRDEVLIAVGIRRDKVIQIASEASRLEALADAMAQHKAERVADLPAEVLAEVLL